MGFEFFGAWDIIGGFWGARWFWGSGILGFGGIWNFWKVFS